MTSPSLPVETKPHRRWQFSHFQFSLRTLLIGVTLCALPMAWLGPKIRQAYHEQGAVAWVTKQGGMVIHEEVWFGQWLPGPVQSVSLYNTQATDLTPLQELTNLEWLNLSGIQVSDLTPLKGLANLEELVLSGTQVSDLTPLKDRTNLRLLYLGDTQVSDLTPLKELTHLEWLSLYRTPVSKEQVQLLKQALPNCEISGP